MFVFEGKYLYWEIFVIIMGKIGEYLLVFVFDFSVVIISLVSDGWKFDY